MPYSYFFNVGGILRKKNVQDYYNVHCIYFVYKPVYEILVLIAQVGKAQSSLSIHTIAVAFPAHIQNVGTLMKVQVKILVTSLTKINPVFTNGFCLLH